MTIRQFGGSPILIQHRPCREHVVTVVAHPPEMAFTLTTVSIEPGPYNSANSASTSAVSVGVQWFFVSGDHRSSITLALILAVIPSGLSKSGIPRLANR